MKPYQFVGLLGVVTTVIGVLATAFNDKFTGIGLITAGVSDMSIAIGLAQKNNGQ